MPNWSYTNITVTGPDAEIERFKEACLFTEPTEEGNGIDFERIVPMPQIEWPFVKKIQIDGMTVDVEDHPVNLTQEQERLATIALAETGFTSSLDWACKNWGTKWSPRVSTYHVDKQGNHQLYLITAWSPPVKVLEKIVASLPSLTLDVHSRDELGNYFVKGTISASGTDLNDDEEAMHKYGEVMAANQGSGVVIIEQSYGPDGLHIAKREGVDDHADDTHAELRERMKTWGGDRVAVANIDEMEKILRDDE